MIPRILTMIPGFGRPGFGRDEIYPDLWIFYGPILPNIHDCQRILPHFPEKNIWVCLKIG